MVSGQYNTIIVFVLYSPYRYPMTPFGSSLPASFPAVQDTEPTESRIRVC